MSQKKSLVCLLFVLTVGLLFALGNLVADEKESEKAPRLTLEQAKVQAELLHETMHATLQTMHRQYFKEDEGTPIPSRVLEGVFDRVERSHNFSFRWLVVDAAAMNIDHEPENEFEKRAVKVLRKGEEAFEQVEEGVYKRAGSILLASQCLKCHLPNRRSTGSRYAGLIISIPVKPEQEK